MAGVARSANSHFTKFAFGWVEYGMRVDLDDLRLFVAVAEAGNLTQGARAAFLSPPAASARIRALEAGLPQPLLVRGNRGVTLTEAGTVMLRHARIVLRQVEAMRDELAGEGAAEAGHLRVLANTTAVTEFMPEVLARFLVTRPRVTVDLQERLTNDILGGVRDGAADLGIVSGDLDWSGLERAVFSTDRLVLAAPLGHPLAAGGPIGFAETLGFAHIGLHEGSTLLAFLRGLMARHGYDRALRVKVRSFEAMCRMVEGGVGIGVVPESAGRRHAQTMRIALVGLTEDWALRDRCVVWRAGSPLPRPARALVEALMAMRAGGVERAAGA